MSRLQLLAVVGMLVCAVGSAACTSSQTPRTEPTTPATSVAPPSEPVAAGQDHTVQLEFGGKSRSYVVHTPPGYDGLASLPLVVVMHSFPGEPAQIARVSQWNAKADKEKALVVYPAGYSSAYNALVCCGSEDDVGFLRTIVAELIGTWKADPKRVYATGLSNGGDMSYKLAVELPDTFAAIAPVSGGFIGPKAADPSYTPSTPVSTITFLGGKDRYFEQFQAGITRWQENRACAPGAPETLTEAITRTKATCRDGSDVHVYRLPGMGHEWPGGGEGAMSDPTAGLSATDLAWEFFAAHTR
ncbi:extracellular catalytic domain type 1 short-chain-length polyhydroxyalkanoate depolymerase [Nocardia brasiliensis]|uniref:extracellular catalytic domain type 1 short-chain-length polyhydroxyalkanoate depolymerase n=1 Tax=Nocardia brasiliensis TaxID=37326 RepID=UPI002453C092|nr:PHB depolymerase family esterase [Nocardia brasiliensis]